MLASGKYPARNVEQNLADLRAQVAACQKGAAELEAMVSHFSLPVVQAYMQHVQNNAEEAVRRVIDALHDGEFTYAMDNGASVKATIRIDTQIALGHHRLHRHQRPTAEQFQRARVSHACRRAVCVPHAGGR